MIRKLRVTFTFYAWDYEGEYTTLIPASSINTAVLTDRDACPTDTAVRHLKKILNSTAVLISNDKDATLHKIEEVTELYT